MTAVPANAAGMPAVPTAAATHQFTPPLRRGTTAATDEDAAIISDVDIASDAGTPRTHTNPGTAMVAPPAPTNSSTALRGSRNR